jgi:c-di-AMP phosphodiesterase-like protein
LPVIYISDKGKLIWENALSVDENISEFLSEIYREVSKPTKGKNNLIQISGKDFAMYTTDIILGKETGTLVIFVDKTEEEILSKKLDDTKTVLGIITIDSYEDIMQGMDEIDKFNTSTSIDKEIVEWVSKYAGVVNKIEKDKYIYMNEKQYVKDLENNSFEILSKMNKISENITKVPVTISIGLSYDEDTLYNRYKSAMTALEIAMGRGGNQAVIRTNKKFDVYGDSSLEIEKTNRVRARTVAQALKDIIEKSEDVYIMGHKNTDIDCIGAAVGIFKIAKTYGKEAKIIVDSKYNSTTKNIITKLKSDTEYKDVFVQKEDIKNLDFENSLLVIVDTHKESYLAAPDMLKEFEKVVIIDHHRRGPEFITDTILTYHEVYASSTSELVTEILMNLDEVNLTTKEAEAIFSGIVIDTKNFTFKTGVRTFEAAAYLKKTGLDIAEIKHMFQNDFETYMAKVNIVKDAEIIDNQIALSVCKENHENISVIAAQAADELLSITGVLASFVLCEVDGVIMISGRSLGDINVQIILEKLGGGGHLTFAGAQIAGVSMQEAKEKLLTVIQEYFKKPE